MRKILDEIDPKGEKDVSFEEFVPLMRRKGQESDFTAFIECFKVFDRENNGMVNVAEVRHLRSNHDDKLKIFVGRFLLTFAKVYTLDQISRDLQRLPEISGNLTQVRLQTFFLSYMPVSAGELFEV